MSVSGIDFVTTQFRKQEHLAARNAALRTREAPPDPARRAADRRRTEDPDLVERPGCRAVLPNSDTSRLLGTGRPSSEERVRAQPARRVEPQGSKRFLQRHQMDEDARALQRRAQRNSGRRRARPAGLRTKPRTRTRPKVNTGRTRLTLEQRRGVRRPPTQPSGTTSSRIETPASPLPANATHRQKLEHAMRRARELGLRITSTTGGRHTPTSYHYRGRAVDVAGSPERMAQYYREMARLNPTELFYDPIGGIKHGRQIGPIGGHRSHVHVAF